jgi:hypothetical protein
MLKRFKALAVAGAVTAMLGSAVPAASAADAAAAAVCRAVGTTTTSTTMTLVVQGQYVGPAGSQVTLTCSVRQYGRTVASFTNASSTNVAAVAGTVTMPLGPYEICYSATTRDPATGTVSYASGC